MTRLHTSAAIVAALFAAASLPACRYTSYAGDGTFTDRGFLSGTDRFVLDLGVVDLAAVGSRDFQLRNLPSERLALGFEVEPIRRDIPPPFDPLVQVTLAGAGAPVVSSSGRLSKWITSTSLAKPDRAVFVYCSGSDDSGWSEAPGTAWGCIFKPQRGSTYALNLTVLEPDARARPYSVRLLVKGGPGDLLP